MPSYSGNSLILNLEEEVVGLANKVAPYLKTHVILESKRTMLMAWVYFNPQSSSKVKSFTDEK